MNVIHFRNCSLFYLCKNCDFETHFVFKLLILFIFKTNKFFLTRIFQKFRRKMITFQLAFSEHISGGLWEFSHLTPNLLEFPFESYISGTTICQY